MKKTEKLVMIFGTFDYLHAGHENFIAQAKKHGTEIIAVIAKDKTVKTIKGESPKYPEKQRVKNLMETGWVNKVILGSNKDKNKAIKIYRPDIIALGYDQFAFTYRLEKFIIDYRLNTEIIRLKPYRPDMYKSTILKEKEQEPNNLSDEFEKPVNLTDEFEEPNNLSNEFEEPNNLSNEFEKPSNLSNEFEKPSNLSNEFEKPSNLSNEFEKPSNLSNEFEK